MSGGGIRFDASHFWAGTHTGTRYPWVPPILLSRTRFGATFFSAAFPTMAAMLQKRCISPGSFSRFDLRRSRESRTSKTANGQGKTSHSVTAYLSQTISTMNGYHAACFRGSDSPVHSPIITLRGLPERERKGRSWEQAHSGHVQPGHSYRARCSFIRRRCDHAS